MGWSHGGFITAHLLFRGETPFKGGVAMVPVTNLLFRLSFKGPGYQRSFSTQQRLQGLPFEQREEYKRRSPYYHVDSLRTPMLVHVATNDEDVNFEEAEPLIDALRARKSALGRDQDLRGPDPRSRQRRPHVQSPREPPDARARRFAGADRLVEPRLGLLGEVAQALSPSTRRLALTRRRPPDCCSPIRPFGVPAFRPFGLSAGPRFAPPHRARTPLRRVAVLNR